VSVSFVPLTSVPGTKTTPGVLDETGEPLTVTDADGETLNDARLAERAGERVDDGERLLTSETVPLTTAVKDGDVEMDAAVDLDGDARGDRELLVLDDTERDARALDDGLTVGERFGASDMVCVGETGAARERVMRADADAATDSGAKGDGVLGVVGVGDARADAVPATGNVAVTAALVVRVAVALAVALAVAVSEFVTEPDGLTLREREPVTDTETESESCGVVESRADSDGDALHDEQ